MSDKQTRLEIDQEQLEQLEQSKERLSAAVGMDQFSDYDLVEEIGPEIKKFASILLDGN